MDRYYAIYHGLTAAAPWGVACERTGPVSPKAELVLLCRSEKEAGEWAALTSLGHEVKTAREGKGAPGEPRNPGAR